MFRLPVTASPIFSPVRVCVHFLILCHFFLQINVLYDMEFLHFFIECQYSLSFVSPTSDSIFHKAWFYAVIVIAGILAIMTTVGCICFARYELHALTRSVLMSKCFSKHFSLWEKKHNIILSHILPFGFVLTGKQTKCQFIKILNKKN